MSEIHKVVFKDNGGEYKLCIEPQGAVEVSNEDADYRDINLPNIDMKKVHRAFEVMLDMQSAYLLTLTKPTAKK
ncbi:MAG: hypothetical protein AAF959_23410 [Cyanobacteria bacterium P01_D01_bin.56]